jgi:hypothetical protein
MVETGFFSKLEYLRIYSQCEQFNSEEFDVATIIRRAIMGLPKLKELVVPNFGVRHSCKKMEKY